MQAAKLLAASGTASKLYAEDVFSAYTYTGNGSTQTITNGIDLAGKGGMVWIKNRTEAAQHSVFFTGIAPPVNPYYPTNFLSTHSAGYLTDGYGGGGTGPWTNYYPNGFQLYSNEYSNKVSIPFISWTFRNADRFYNHTTVTKSSGSNATVSFSNLTTLGMVRVKRTDAAGSWYIWHRSLTAGKLLIGETTAAEATLGHITVSGTTVTLVNGTIADGTYLVEGFAHDTGPDGLIQCGSFTTDGSGNATVNLGWEPQFVLRKNYGAAGQWFMEDVMRGMSQTNVKWLYPNLSDAEVDGGGWCKPTATGFNAYSIGASQTFIYLAIRRPNKPPTTGTQVYNAIARTGTGAAATVTGVGFAPDLVIPQNRNTANGTTWFSRLQGATKLLLNYGTNAELTDANSLTSFGMDGFSAGTDATHACINTNTNTYINHFFKRAPGVFDVVCYTGTGSATTVSHGLGAVPELMIVKLRGSTGDWHVYFGDATKAAFLNYSNAPAASANYWNNSAPTASAFAVGATNSQAYTYVAYLFATLAGVSKVGSYTGNGSSQTIACGFTTGARFILIKRTDSTGDWYVWDTTRGIIAGNDPYLLLNSTAAEVTGTDYIDPSTSGFELSSTAPAAINASGGTFIYLAFA